MPRTFALYLLLEINPIAALSAFLCCDQKPKIYIFNHAYHSDLVPVPPKQRACARPRRQKRSRSIVSPQYLQAATRASATDVSFYKHLRGILLPLMGLGAFQVCIISRGFIYS